MLIYQSLVCKVANQPYIANAINSRYRTVKCYPCNTVLCLLANLNCWRYTDLAFFVVLRKLAITLGSIVSRVQDHMGTVHQLSDFLHKIWSPSPLNLDFTTAQHVSKISTSYVLTHFIAEPSLKLTCRSYPIGWKISKTIAQFLWDKQFWKFSV